MRLFPVVLGLFALTLGLFLPTSCTKETFDDFQDEELVEMIITVGGNTKTSNEGDSTIWSKNDELSVIHSAPNATTFWLSPFTYYPSYGNNAFYGTVSKLSANNDWYAVYPYNASHTSAESVSLTFPALQTQTGNSTAHLAGTDFPMVGKATNVARSTDLSIRMENLLAVAEFKVKNTISKAITVEQIEFTASSPIAGAFSVNLTGDAPVLTAGAAATKTVKLDVAEGEQIAVDADGMFYMGVAPFQASAGTTLKFKILAKDADGNTIPFYYSLTLKNDATFTSNEFQTIQLDFDDEHQNNPDAGSAGEVVLPVGGEPDDGVYLLVYENGANSMAFAPFDEYESQNFAIPVVVTDGVVLPQDGINLARFAVELENTGKEHPNDAGHNAYNVRNSEGKYVFYATAGGTYEGTDALHILDSNEMEVQGTNYQYYHTFMQTEDGVRIVCSINTGGNFYLLSYTTADGFNYQQDNAAGTNLHLFRIGGTVKEKQYPAFSAERVEYDFDANGPGVLANAPTLSNAKTSVTYSSSNESVASVDAEGKVTVHKAGTATITATAAADDVYYSATAQYLIVATTSAGTTFYRVTEFTAGEQYLIVSAGKALTNSNGSIGATDVSASGDEILVSDAASMTWTATASGSGFTLANNGYYVQRASSSGGGKPNISNSPNTSYYVWNYDGSNLYNGSTSAYSTNFYYLYYNSGWAQTTNSSSAGTVTIYSSTKPLIKQTLSFAQSSVVWTIGEGYELKGSYAFPQTVTGNVTPVTYTSSNTNVATISNNRITIVATGSTTIKARTEGNDDYAPAEATYVLRIREPITGEFVNLNDLYNNGEPFNLENDYVRRYLNDAESKYTDTNYKGTNKITVVSDYTSGSTRKDVPQPVPIQWDTESSGTTTITIYSDEQLTEQVWAQTTTSGKTSDDVYNLIPGQTYYCTVTDADETLLLKGVFETTGRRRMIRVSTTQNQNNGNNCRDLGGLKTTDGRRIKYGMIFRGTNLDGTKKNNADVAIPNYVAPNNSEQGLLANYLNIGYDIDLRAGGTKAFLDKYNVTYVYGNMQPYLSDVTDKDKSTTTLKGFFDAAAAGKASYFHCAIGSDRTGFWGLLIEGLLGVSVKDCSIDFELTSFYNLRERTNTGYLFYQGMENTSGSFKGLANYDGANFQQKCVNFVKSLDSYFTDERIEAFRNAVLEPDPDPSN